MCAIKIDGNLGCWNPNNNNSSEAIPEKYKNDIKQIDSNMLKTCVVTNQNKVKCWSYEEYLKIPKDYS